MLFFIILAVFKCFPLLAHSARILFFNVSIVEQKQIALECDQREINKKKNLIFLFFNIRSILIWLCLLFKKYWRNVQETLEWLITTWMYLKTFKAEIRQEFYIQLFLVHLNSANLTSNCFLTSLIFSSRQEEKKKIWYQIFDFWLRNVCAKHRNAYFLEKKFI